MAEKPVIFSTPMIKMILTCAKCGKISVAFPCSFCGSEDFRKTVTRRLNGLKEINIEPDRWQFSHMLCNPPEGIFIDKYDTLEQQQKELRGQKIKFAKASYQEGDVLWCKEPLVEYEIDDISFTKAFYEADLKPCGITWGWKRDRLPGMFMPKDLARIWLEVLDVRPELLQKITEEDAQKEGFNSRDEFLTYWDVLNKPRGYPSETNPWVWRYEFKRIDTESLETLNIRN